MCLCVCCGASFLSRPSSACLLTRAIVIHGYPFPPPLFSSNGIQHVHVVTHTIMMVIAFIHRFESLLKDMTDDTFASHRESLVNQKLELDDSLGDEASRHWNEIASGRARGASPFFSHVREAAFLQRVEKQDLLAWFQEHILGNGNSNEGAKEGAKGAETDAETDAEVGVDASSGGRRRMAIHVVSSIATTGFSGQPPAEGESWTVDLVEKGATLSGDALEGGGAALPKAMDHFAPDSVTLGKRYADGGAGGDVVEE